MRGTETLRIRVLGGLALEADGRPLDPPAGRPARSVLGWLALHPGRHQRAVVAAALWPDVLDASARASLRTALSAVRRALGDAADAALLGGRDHVGLAGPPHVEVDALEFERLLEAGRPADALALARGDLLLELGDEWVLEARDRHRDRCSTALAALADAAAAQGDADAALSWARRRAQLDPFDEAAHRDLMARLAAVGEEAAALAVYERLAARLRRELGVAASPPTRTLAAALRAEPAAAEETALAPAVLPRVLRRERWRSAFVGRAAALARLEAAWAAIPAGGVGIALLVGPPGIGKSRLSAHFAAVRHEQGATVLAGGAEPDGLEPYAPLVEALRSGGRAVPDFPDASSDASVGRLRVRELLAEALDAADGGSGLVLVVDDVQWADSGTLDAIAHLTRRGLRGPLLVLATSRPGAGAAAVVGLGAAAPLTRLDLDGLDEAEVAALVGQSRNDVPEQDVRALAARTAGNPFFLQALLDAGPVTADAELPAAVADVIVARLEALGPDVRRVLEAAALLGSEFDVELAAATAGLAPDAALAALDDAAAAHLVSLAGAPGRLAFVHALVQEALDHGAPPGERAAAHARALAALRPRVDAGSDEALTAAARHALAAVPLVPATAAAALAEQAADALVRGYAPAEAATLLEQAVALLDGRGEPLADRARVRCALAEALDADGARERAAAVFADAAALARRADAGAELARAALGVAGPAVAIVAVDRERVAVLEEGLAAAPPSDVALRSRLEARLAIELAYDADPMRRDAVSARALVRARGSGDARSLAAALGARHVVLWGPDHTLERMALADEMLALARRAGDEALELQARTRRIVDLAELGDGPAFDAELDAYAAAAARSRLATFAWYVPVWRSVRAFLAGRPEEGHDLRRRAFELGTRAGDANAQFVRLADINQRLADGDIPYEVYGAWHAERMRTSPVAWAYRSMYAWMLAANGREEQARAEVADQRRRGMPQSWPRDTNWLSAVKEMTEAAHLLGDRELGVELEELLQPFADRMAVAARAMNWMGSIAGALALMAELRGDPPTAVDRYRRAIELEERAGMPVWACHHRVRLARALRAAGADEEAGSLLAEAVSEARRLSLFHLAERAGR